MTNAQFSDATHVFYNGKTNEMVSIHYREDLEMFQVELYSEFGRLYVSIMSMDRIYEDSKGETWEFLGVL